MKKIESHSSCGVVVDYVIDLIANRKLNIGDRLVPERTLAINLNVSRATIREAINVLKHLGFIDSSQGSGNYVTNTYDQTVAKIMRVMYIRGDVDFNNFTLFRQMLELQAFDMALENATQTQKQEMTQILALLDVSTDSNLIVSLDNRFHTLLAEASHNPLILINFYALSSVINEYMSDTYFGTVSKKASGFGQLQTYHRAIVDALISKDRKKGHQAIKDHFSWLRA